MRIKLSQPIEHIRTIGIDVAQATHSVCVYYDNHNTDDIVLSNTETDITMLIKKIQGFSGRIVLESTGRHHLLCAVLLAEAGCDVRVINPLIAKKYSLAQIRKIKTDKQDARILAEIGFKETKLPPPFNPDRNTIKIKK